MSLEKARSIETGLQTIVGRPEDFPAINEKVKKKSFLTRSKYILSHMTVEPMLAFYILPSMMIAIAVQNLNLEKACRVNLGISMEHCDALTIRNQSAYPDYQKDDERVQTLATYLSMLKNLVQSTIPAIILLFLGSWSDKYHKRKACMIVPVLGDIACITGLIFCVYYFYEWPMEMNLIFESVFPAICGTWFAMFTGVYSYISDVSSEEERTMRIGAANTVTNICVCLGTAFSGILYGYIGFYGVFFTGLVMELISLTYGCFSIHDSTENKDKIESKGFCSDFFQTSHIKDTFKTAFRSSNKRGRKRRVIGTMILFVLVVGPYYGEINVVYFFTRLRFGWNSIKYSFFTTFQFVASTLGTMFSLWMFSNKLKLDDPILGIISSCSKILGVVIYAFAPTERYFFLGVAAEFLNGTSFIAARAMISKLVEAEELGKINSILGILEALVPLIYGPLYNRIYAFTIDFFPGCFYLVGGVLTFPAVILFYWLYLEQKKEFLEHNAELINQHESKLLENHTEKITE